MLSLYKNQTPIGEPREGQNLHTFQAASSDNSAAISCSAINSVMTAPLVSEIFLNVLCKLPDFVELTFIVLCMLQRICMYHSSNISAIMIAWIVSFSSTHNMFMLNSALKFMLSLI